MPANQRPAALNDVCPTIKIRHLDTGEEMVINASDFDAEKHEKTEKLTRRPIKTAVAAGEEKEAEKAPKGKKSSAKDEA